jgi:3-oxoacyl-[acyl-carrier-protein] synthase II
MIYINGYGCTTAAGRGVDSLWTALASGIDHRQEINATGPGWQTGSLSGAHVPSACLWARTGHLTMRELLLEQLHLAWREAKAAFSSEFVHDWNQKPIGVICASTKGYVDDVIWSELPQTDLVTPLLEQFVREAELRAELTTVVSNACTSSLSAMWLADQWIAQGRVDHVVLLAFDAVGPFVYQGFDALHALAQEKVRPFSQNRDGLQLGEAAVAMVLSKNPISANSPRVSGTGIDGEGYAVTRPSPSGASVARAIRMAMPVGSSQQAVLRNPQLVIAHGTGTTLNDVVEDQVLSEIFASQPPVITGSKWSIGHCLGASGAVDVVLACETLRRQKCFSIANTETVDPAFKGRYLTAARNHQAPSSIHTVLVTSLGFGGIHAASLIELPQDMTMGSAT